MRYFFINIHITRSKWEENALIFPFAFRKPFCMSCQDMRIQFYSVVDLACTGFHLGHLPAKFKNHMHSHSPLISRSFLLFHILFHIFPWCVLVRWLSLPLTSPRWRSGFFCCFTFLIKVSLGLSLYYPWRWIGFCFLLNSF